MPISLTAYELGTLCIGHEWEIIDEELLTKLVAEVLIGKSRHVTKVLQGIVGVEVNYRVKAADNAIEKLTGSNIYHRDGLLFQIFSWIAANKSSDSNTVIAAPHLIPAHKGFDGLKVKIASDQSVSSVVIFEDKATTNPRSKITGQVWPEFRELFSGQRENELMQEVTSLVESRRDLVDDVDEVIEDIVWGQVRQYRVAVTTEDALDLTDAGKRSLFRGFDTSAPTTSATSRQAELIHIAQLRTWMSSFSQKVIDYLEEVKQDV